MLGMIVLCIICSVITSACVTKILATHYFEIVDGYVDDMVKKTKEFIRPMEHRADGGGE